MTEEKCTWKIQEAWTMNYSILKLDSNSLDQGQGEHQEVKLEDLDLSEILKSIFTGKVCNH